MIMDYVYGLKIGGLKYGISDGGKTGEII